MHVLIAGGTGLIGQALTAELRREGHRVTVLSRSSQSAPTPQGASVVPWDAKTPRGWEHLLQDTDAIVNLAGENLAGTGLLPSRWTPEQKQRIRSSRIQVGEAIAQTIATASRVPKVLIQASGIGYYGPKTDNTITEGHPPGDDFLAGLAKEWEASTAEVEGRGVRRAIIRTGMVLSVHGGALPKLLLPYKLLVGGPLGSGRQYISWIHIMDEVRAIRFLIDHESASGPFNLCAPDPLTNADFGRAVGRVLMRPYLIPTPAFVMRWVLGEASTLVLDGQRALPMRLQEAGFTFRFHDAEAALRDLLRH